MQPNELAQSQEIESDLLRTTTFVEGSVPDTDVSLESGPAPPMPQQVSRFVIRRRLGQGGFGSVYLAYDPTLEREIALKLPARSVWTKQQQHAFLREARTAAKLKHPHVAAIYDAGTSDADGVFIAMEFVAGQSLAQRLKRGKLSGEEAKRICGQIADAMHHGHKLGLVHRDLKPSNILLDGEGNVKVCDFGLAIREEEQKFRRGDASGTLSYMSPEQVRGESHLLDGRSDIWSLGVILYECLAGRRPFRGEEAAELREEILARDPRPLRQLDDTIPESLDELCRRCLRRSPAERPPTALDVQRALVERPVAAPRRRPRIAVVLVLIASLFFVAVSVVATRPWSALSQSFVTNPASGITNLFANVPEVACFSPANGMSTWAYDREQRRVDIDSHHWTLLSLGKFAGRRQLDVSAMAGRGPAPCGVFWGLHPQAGPEGTVGVCLLVMVEPAQPHDTTDKSAMVRLYRFHFGKDYLNPTIVTNHNFGGIPLDVDWTKHVGFQLAITDGELTSLRVQGQRVEFPLGLIPPDQVPDWKAFADGKCGVAAWRKKVSFTSALLTTPR